MTVAVFTCSICGEQSTQICARCTKDTCRNHLCEKCAFCSDCCDCDVPLTPEQPLQQHAAPPHEPLPTPHPGPDPDPAPDPEPIPMVAA